MILTVEEREREGERKRKKKRERDHHLPVLCWVSSGDERWPIAQSHIQMERKEERKRGSETIGAVFEQRL